MSVDKKDPKNRVVLALLDHIGSLYGAARKSHGGSLQQEAAGLWQQALRLPIDSQQHLHPFTHDSLKYGYFTATCNLLGSLGGSFQS